LPFTSAGFSEPRLHNAGSQLQEKASFKLLGAWRWRAPYHSCSRRNRRGGCRGPAAGALGTRSTLGCDAHAEATCTCWRGHSRGRRCCRRPICMPARQRAGTARWPPCRLGTLAWSSAQARHYEPIFVLYWPMRHGAICRPGQPIAWFIENNSKKLISKPIF
jgi:hypothetical protein